MFDPMTWLKMDDDDDDDDVNGHVGNPAGSNESSVSIILSHLSKQYGGLHFRYPTSTRSVISLLIYNHLNGWLDDVMAQRVKDEKKNQTQELSKRKLREGRATREETRVRY